MSTKPKLKLKKMKDFPNILHIDSNLVLTSLEDKTVIGKYENRKIVLLNKADINLCNEWKLIYDPEKINEDEDEDEDDDKEEVEEQKDVDNEDEEKELDNEENNEEKELDNVEEQKKNDDEEKNQVHEEQKEVSVKEHISTNNLPNSQNILDMATQFAKDIHNNFDLLTHFYTEKILNYENKISTMDIEYNNLLLKYNSEYDLHSNTKEDLKKLQSKFEGIKSLFN